MHKVLPDFVPHLYEGKTVMHCLHPERFEPKKEEVKEEKKGTKKGKKGKKKEEEKEEVFIPKYAEVEDQPEGPVTVGLVITVDQVTQAPGGTFVPYYKRLNTIYEQI